MNDPTFPIAQNRIGAREDHSPSTTRYMTVGELADAIEVPRPVIRETADGDIVDGRWCISWAGDRVRAIDIEAATSVEEMFDLLADLADGRAGDLSDAHRETLRRGLDALGRRREGPDGNS